MQIPDKKNQVIEKTTLSTHQNVPPNSWRNPYIHLLPKKLRACIGEVVAAKILRSPANRPCMWSFLKRRAFRTLGIYRGCKLTVGVIQHYFEKLPFHAHDYIYIYIIRGMSWGQYLCWDCQEASGMALFDLCVLFAFSGLLVPRCSNEQAIEHGLLQAAPS